MEPLTQSNKEVDLNLNHAIEIQAFRDSLRSMDDDADRFQACTQMRDKLLRQQAKLEWLCASVEEIMLAECVQYKKERNGWSTQQDNGNADTKQWARFVSTAKAGGELRKQCLAPLTKASGYWGVEKVRHYEWAYAGGKYCKMLGTAASRIPDWNEALVKLNQLILRRINAHWRPLVLSANPIDQIDLENLKNWSGDYEFKKEGNKGFRLQYQPVSYAELPSGYTFDQYGLITSEEIAARPQWLTSAGAQCAAQTELSNDAAKDYVDPALISAPSPDAAIDDFTLSISPSPPNRQTPNTPLTSSRATSPLASNITPSVASETDESMRLTPLLSPTLNALSSLPVTFGDDAAPANADLIRTSDRLRLAPITDYKESAAARKATSSQRNTSNRAQKGGKQDCASRKYSCFCFATVTSAFLSAIERGQQNSVAEDAEVAVKYGSQRNELCMEHLKMYASWATRGMLLSQHPMKARHLIDFTETSGEASSSRDSVTRTKRRRLSLPEAGPDSESIFRKVPRRDDFGTASVQARPATDGFGERPIHDALGDALFREDVLAQLEQKAKSKARPPKTWGEMNNQVMYRLLRRSSQPVTVGGENQIEAYFLTGEEAATRLDTRAVLHGPIITMNQQQFRWDHRKDRPIEQLFRRIGNPNRVVSVQKPSLDSRGPSSTRMRLGNVEDIFRENNVSEDPLNVLDLRNPLPRSVLPNFLTGEDCQLLSRVRDTVLEGATAERCTASITEWNKWKDDEDWVLLAQGGAQTLTHEDSCGKATWLTVQEGQIGFGWISRPTEEERRA